MIDRVLDRIAMDTLKFFEEEFVKSEPLMQTALINYAKTISSKLDEWAKRKLEKH